MTSGSGFTAAGLLPAPPVADPSALGGQVSTRRAPRLRRCLSLVANLVMLAMVAVFTLVAVLPATGARAMIVLSGSMEPLLSAGDAAIIRDVPVEQLQVGDVITFQGIGEDRRLTTHRIIDLVQLDSGLHFQTQGDANTSPDVDLAPATNVVGRYDGRIPHGGRALLLLSSRQAKIGLVAFPALLIAIGEVRKLLAALAARRATAPARPARGYAVGLASLLLAAAVGVGVTRVTMAVFTDVMNVGENTFTTADTF